MDGILPRAPADVFSAHDEMRLPLLIGNNAREALGPQSDDLARTLDSTFGAAAPLGETIDLQSDAAEAPNPILGTPANILATDISFRCSAVTIQSWHAQQGSAVLAYQFEAPTPGAPKLGAQHSSELMYVFGLGNLGRVGVSPLSQTVVTYWTNFVKQVDPNGQAVPPWPKFNTTTGGYVHIGLAGEAGCTAARGSLRSLSSSDFASPAFILVSLTIAGRIAHGCCAFT